MRRNILLTSALAVVLLTASCNKFLDESSKTKLDLEEVYSDPDLVEKSLQGLYTKWKNIRTDEQGTIMMMGTDETQQGAFQMKSDPSKGGLDRFDANLNSGLGQIASQWDMRWPVINEAARIVYGLGSNNPEVGSREAKLLGEASFIRGFIYFQMALYWGEVPIRDLAREAELGTARQPIKDVWEFIIADLVRATELLPTDGAKVPERATYGAAMTMLGKAYMSAPEETGLRDFKKAADCFSKIIGQYSLVDYADLWDYRTPNTSESIFEFQFNNVNPNNNKVQYQIGSRAVQGDFGDACYFAGYDKVLPTKYAYSDVADGGIWEEGDLRKEESIRYDFTYNGVEPTLSSVLWEDLGAEHDELMPHIKKYEDPRTSNDGIKNMWNGGKNIPVLRLADVILSYAECLNELGETTEAVNQVNIVRTRAWGGSLPADKAWVAMSQDEFRDKIMDERMRELFAEDWRKIDLIRTGKMVELVKARNKWANQSGMIKEFHTKFPIPNTEIKLNPDINDTDQNEGYN